MCSELCIKVPVRRRGRGVTAVATTELPRREPRGRALQGGDEEGGTSGGFTLVTVRFQPVGAFELEKA